MPLYVNGQEMKCFLNGTQRSGYVNGTKMFGQFGLSFSGNQWIDSGIFGQRDLLYRIAFKNMTRFAYPQGLLGANYTTTGERILFQLGGSYSGNKDWGCGRGRNALAYNESPINKINTIVVPKHNEHLINGNMPLYGIIPAQNNFTNTTTVLVGSCNIEGGTPMPGFIGTIYYCALTLNNEIIRDFVPVSAGSTTYSSTPAPSNCFWDKVTQSYFENAGTGTIGISK